MELHTSKWALEQISRQRIAATPSRCACSGVGDGGCSLLMMCDAAVVAGGMFELVVLGMTG